MLIEYGVWGSRLVVGVVFGLSAWGKLADRVGTRTAVADFGVPIRWVPAVAWGLPAVEAVVAAGVLPPWTAAWAAFIAFLLLTGFTAAIARLLARGKRPACSCFGALSAAPIGVRTLVRNGLLMVLAAIVGWGALRYPRVPAGLPADNAVGLGVVAVLVALLIWLFGTVDTLRKRLDAQALSTLGAEGLPVGAVAPEFQLLDVAGDRTSLESLLAQGRNVLLVFIHPGCEMCAALARELPRWHARTRQSLTIVLVGNGDAAEHAAWGREVEVGDIPVLVQQGNEAALRYRVRGTPSAVLIDADGRMAAPVARGAIATRELIMSTKTVVRLQTPECNGTPAGARR
ncbi:redoxin domain-containing protein [Nocardia sp. NBC_00565]|uniref:peroxiredoxin family protein n=1 Tax=Nocardia sp. NBC_00565 TaxID=2975993 RepID=UPI002E80D75B|nr:MauE/DoxX family redox-associated membrane protein [Nocardia sp. NBC_00565]WUC01904.1 redoxin domain-containing protein [Nocardia sp. NBC_00565]